MTLLDKLYQINCNCCNSSIVTAELDSEYESIIRALAKLIFTGEWDKYNIPADLYLKIADDFNGAIDKAFKTKLKNIDYNSPDNLMLQKLRTNVYQFSSAKSTTELLQINNLLTDAEGNLRTFSEFYDEIKKLNHRFNYHYLHTEYNYCLASSQMASRWADIEAKKSYIPYLKYDAVNDERTRDSHRLLEGITLPVDSKFWDKYYPPNGWNCRCDVQQVAVPGTLSESEAMGLANGSKVIQDKIFSHNSGKTGVIFDKGHLYFNNINKKKIADAANYGMKSVVDILNRPGKLPELQPAMQSEAEALELWQQWVKKNNGKAGFQLVCKQLNLNVGFTQQFANHVIYENKRFAIFNNTLNIFTNPDEIWQLKIESNKYKTFNGYAFIKYYKNKPMTLLVNQDTMEVISTYELKPSAYENLRRDTLIFKK